MKIKGKRLSRLRRILSMQAKSYDLQAQQDIANEAIKIVEEVTGSVLTVEEDDKGNFYITKGDSDLYPCAVAHLDQVHTPSDVFRVIRSGDTLLAFDGKVQVGIGGDDKCGVFLCVEMLIKYDNVKVALFVDEEVGCQGSGRADLTFFNDCCFILQGDRNHYKNDFIWHTNSSTVASPEFKLEAAKYFKPLGYSLAEGTITDVGELANNGVGISCANIACGYLNAHTSREIISISKLASCLKLFESIFENMSDKRWVHTELNTETYGSYGSYWGGSSWSNRNYNRSSSSNNSNSKLLLGLGKIEESDSDCENCGSVDTIVFNKNQFYCKDCGRIENIEDKSVIYKGLTNF